MSETHHTDKVKKYALFTAVCFAMFSVYKAVDEIKYLPNYGLIGILVTIVEIDGYIGMAIASFIRNRKYAFFAAGTCFCVKTYLFISYFSTDYSKVFGLWFLSYTALLVIILLSLKGKRNKYIWYIPSLLLVIRWLYISKLFNFDVVTMLNADNRLSYLALILEAITFLCAGLWLKEELPAEKEKNPD